MRVSKERPSNLTSFLKMELVSAESLNNQIWSALMAIKLKKCADCGKKKWIGRSKTRCKDCGRADPEKFRDRPQQTRSKT
jgi:ribosomal protein L32